jgi:hypothetical protein
MNMRVRVSVDHDISSEQNEDGQIAAAYFLALDLLETAKRSETVDEDRILAAKALLVWASREELRQYEARSISRAERVEGLAHQRVMLEEQAFNDRPVAF